MPLYDYFCWQCCQGDSRIVPVDDRDNQSCQCGAPLDRDMSAGSVALIGPTAINPLRVGGETLTSNAEVRAWEKRNPGMSMISSSDLQRKKDRVRERANQNARKQGYSDLEDKQRRRKEHFSTKGKITVTT